MNNPIDRLKAHLQYRVDIEKQGQLDEDIKHVLKRLEAAEAFIQNQTDYVGEECGVPDCDNCTSRRLYNNWRKAKDEQ